MSAVFIRLGHGETDERLKKPETEYGIPRTKEFNEEVAKMCTYSQFMLDRGEKKALKPANLKPTTISFLMGL